MADSGREQSRQPRLAQEILTFVSRGQAKHQFVRKPDNICPATRPLNGSKVDSMPSKNGCGKGPEAIPDLAVEVLA